MLKLNLDLSILENYFSWLPWVIQLYNTTSCYLGIQLLELPFIGARIFIGKFSILLNLWCRYRNFFFSYILLKYWLITLFTMHLRLSSKFHFLTRKFSPTASEASSRNVFSILPLPLPFSLQLPPWHA